MNTQSTPLTQFERQTYERIVSRGEEVLARWLSTNPMRPSVERQVADARRRLGLAS